MRTHIFFVIVILLAHGESFAQNESRNTRDTSFRIGNYSCQMKEKGERIEMKLKSKNTSGDSIMHKLIFSGSYAPGREREQYFDTSLSIPRPIWPLINSKDYPEHMTPVMYFGGFSLGTAIMTGEGYDRQIKSLRYGINMLRMALPISEHFVFCPGLNIEFNSLHFKDNMAYIDRDGVTRLEPAPVGETYETSRLHVTYMGIPVMLRGRFGITPGRPRDFTIDFGPELKFRMASSSKVWFPDKKKFRKLGTDMNLAPISVDLRMQIGYRRLGLYGTYALTPMFKDGKGPDTRLVSIGGYINF